MAPKSGHLLLIAVLSIIAVTAIASQFGDLGIFKPVVRTDPKLTELAKFAVEEHNKETKSALVFDRVSRGEIQKMSPSGPAANYQICFFAKNGDAVESYTTIVVVPPNNGPLKLYAFKKKEAP